MDNNNKQIAEKPNQWLSLGVTIWALLVMVCYSLQYFEPAQMSYIRENLSKILGWL